MTTPRRQHVDRLGEHRPHRRERRSARNARAYRVRAAVDRPEPQIAGVAAARAAALRGDFRRTPARGGEPRATRSSARRSRRRSRPRANQLELRYLGAGPRLRTTGGDRTKPGLPVAGSRRHRLPAVAGRTRRSSTACRSMRAASAAIARAAAKAGDPELMTRGGLFLQKLRAARDARAISKRCTAR